MYKYAKSLLIGAGIGFVISEYLVLRTGVKVARSVMDEQKKEVSCAKWAAHMVTQEVNRGKYDNSPTLDVVTERAMADYKYYYQIASSLGIRGST